MDRSSLFVNEINDKSYQVVVQEHGGGQVTQEVTITIKETQQENLDPTIAPGIERTESRGGMLRTRRLIIFSPSSGKTMQIA